MHIRLGSDKVSVERYPQDRRSVGKTNNNSKLFHRILCFFSRVIAPLATQKNVASCHFRLNLCLGAQSYPSDMEVWAASEVWLSLLPLCVSAQQNQFPELICAAGPGSSLCEGCNYGGAQDFGIWQHSAHVFLWLWKTPLGSGCLAWTFHPQELVLCISEAQHCRWKICFISVYLSMLLTRNNYSVYKDSFHNVESWMCISWLVELH